MDVVYIRGLRVDTVIGVYPWERTVRQVLEFDIEMASDTAAAARSDAALDALDDEAQQKVPLIAVAEPLTGRCKSGRCLGAREHGLGAVIQKQRAIH